MIRHSSIITLMFLLLACGCEVASEGPTGTGRQALQTPAGTVLLSELRGDAFGPAVELVTAPWGEGEGACLREEVAAQTGPMAIAALPEGGVAIVDTVGARVHRFGPAGELLETVATGVETADDIVVGDDGFFALLVYRRAPVPHHEVLIRGRDGSWRPDQLLAAEVNLPTALWADGSRLYVEQRHGWLHAVVDDGTSDTPRLWGRPAGEHLLRLRRLPDGAVDVAARTRRGELAWARRIVAPWPVTEILALEVGGPVIALVLRRVFDESEGGGQETWLVALDRSGGEPLGRQLLRDARVTDAGRPFTVGADGTFYELTTDAAGTTVLAYALRGGAR